MAKAKKKSARPVAKKAAKPAMKSHNPAKCDCPCHEEHCASSFCGIACHCPLFGVLSTKTFWFASLLGTIVAFAFDMWWHGSLLMPSYEATAHLWRPMSEMETMFAWCIAYHVGIAMAVSALVLLMGRTSTWWGGTITGVLAMAPVAICNASAYMHLPLADMSIPGMWAVGALLQGGLLGITVTAITRCKSCCGGLCK